MTNKVKSLALILFWEEKFFPHSQDSVLATLDYGWGVAKSTLLLGQSLAHLREQRVNPIIVSPFLFI